MRRKLWTLLRVSNEEHKCNLDQQLSSKDLKTLQGHASLCKLPLTPFLGELSLQTRFFVSFIAPSVPFEASAGAVMMNIDSMDCPDKWGCE
ncbi:hypothetical protein AV530_013650 [Patagioenas fasciata monilis]|uniref:Uncharacterized protein n=1 Tax=Patagioenas fasciata monilis TaxID=372326 RepID=A0A1V4J8M0_PATFA|nr:hypothetical protein AV530_013650 [Patagioenas fasciata monilis]